MSQPSKPENTAYTPVAYTIKEWAEDDRPREKLFSRGAAVLSNAELLAILLGSGSIGETAVQLAQRILNDSGNDLNELGKRSIADLKKYRGMGDAKAITVMAAVELARRRAATAIPVLPTIGSAADAYAHLAPVYTDLPHEEFHILLLNRANRVLNRVQVSSGGVTGTVVDAKQVFKFALENLACNIILSHNHPSGNRQPSEADRTLTRRLCEGAKLLEMTVLDHLIITSSGFFSFAEEGLM